MEHRTLAHYEILEVIGRGGMGVVDKARDTRLGRLAAIKVLPAEALSDPEREQRFIHEGETPVATLSAVLEREPTPIRELVEDVPPELERLIGRCLRKDRNRRMKRATSGWRSGGGESATSAGRADAAR